MNLWDLPRTEEEAIFFSFKDVKILAKASAKKAFDETIPQ